MADTEKLAALVLGAAATLITGILSPKPPPLTPNIITAGVAASAAPVMRSISKDLTDAKKILVKLSSED